MKYINAAELPEVPNMYFIYGDGGTGKTTLLKQFEGPKLLMSFDHSVNAIRGEKDITFCFWNKPIFRLFKKR